MHVLHVCAPRCVLCRHNTRVHVQYKQPMKLSPSNQSTPTPDSHTLSQDSELFYSPPSYPFTRFASCVFEWWGNLVIVMVEHFVHSIRLPANRLPVWAKFSNCTRALPAPSTARASGSQAYSEEQSTVKTRDRLIIARRRVSGTTTSSKWAPQPSTLSPSRCCLFFGVFLPSPSTTTKSRVVGPMN